MSDFFNISNFTKTKVFDLPFEVIKNEILGSKYNLSLVFIGERRSKNLNKKYRDKNKVANILSFPISKNEGEIFITSQKAKRQAHLFNKNFKEFVGFLFIHGLLHLKGMEHSSTMEELEDKFFSKFFERRK